MAKSRKSRSKPYNKETKTRRFLLQKRHHICRVSAGSAFCKACQVFVKWDEARAFDPQEWQAHMQTWQHGEKARARTAALKAEKRAKSGEASTPAAVHSDFELRKLHWTKENDEPQSKIVRNSAIHTGKDGEDLLEEKVLLYPTRFRRKVEAVLGDLVVPVRKDDLEESTLQYPTRFRRKTGMSEESGVLQ